MFVKRHAKATRTIDKILQAGDRWPSKKIRVNEDKKYPTIFEY